MGWINEDFALPASKNLSILNVLCLKYGVSLVLDFRRVNQTSGLCKGAAGYYRW
jgi:hypothetical protein